MDHRNALVSYGTLERGVDLYILRVLELANQIESVGIYDPEGWETDVMMPTEEKDLPGWTLKASWSAEDSFYNLFTNKHLVLDVRTNKHESKVSYTLYAPLQELGAVQATVEPLLLKLYPKTDFGEEGNITKVRFWSFNNGRATTSVRKVEVPNWQEIDTNYGHKTAFDVTELINLDVNQAVGKLILWYGPPGTGKTFAIRALTSHWKSFCDINYIMDPEQLLAVPAYLMSILSGLDDDTTAHAVFDRDGNYRFDIKGKPRKRLFILEDSDEFMLVDAKAKTGQALSRLLNVTDGILGQGLGLYFLITTNEELGKIHPAVNRAGRCLSQIEFAPLSKEEALFWCKHNKVDPKRVNGSTSLTDLYALKDNRHTSTPIKKSVMPGFN